METINRPFSLFHVEHLPWKQLTALFYRRKRRTETDVFWEGFSAERTGGLRENRLVRPPPSLQFIIKPHKQKSTERHGRGEEEKKRKKTKTKTKRDFSTAAPEKGLVNRRPIPSSSPAVITQMRNNPPPHALLRSATMRRHMRCYGLPRCAATCAATVCLFFCHLHFKVPYLLIISNI